MAKLLRSLLGFQSGIILLAALQAFFDPAGATADGAPLSGTPPGALHVMGLSSLTLSAMQLVMAVYGSRAVLRVALGTMAATKVLAVMYLAGDGMTGVATWEGVSGAVFAIAVVGGF